jgi:hypothetical protein
MVKYPNLCWAIQRRRLAHYEVAAAIIVDPSRFSRCLNGRAEFAPHEQARLSELLGFDAAWLFAEPLPRRLRNLPAHERPASPEAT